MASSPQLIRPMARAPTGIAEKNPNSFAPPDGISRHPDQFYEMLGDLVIAVALVKLRGKTPEGGTVLRLPCSIQCPALLRVLVRGNAPVLLFGPKNAQWTALAILAVALTALVTRICRRRTTLTA